MDSREDYEKFIQAHVPESVTVVHVDDHTTNIVLTDEQKPVCDFCNAISKPDEGKIYPARDIVIMRGGPLGDHHSLGEWGACNECAKLIDKDDRQSLLNRAIELSMKTYPDMNVMMSAAFISASHRAFFRARIV